MSQQSRQITPGSTYTVQPGDTLWDIAQRAYADPEDWDTIYDANKQVIGNDPNLIKPGQVLHIPTQSDPGKSNQPAHSNQPTQPTHPNSPTPPTPPSPPTPPTPPTQPTDSGDGNNIFDNIEDSIEKELGEKKDD